METTIKNVHIKGKELLQLQKIIKANPYENNAFFVRKGYILNITDKGVVWINKQTELPDGYYNIFITKTIVELSIDIKDNKPVRAEISDKKKDTTITTEVPITFHPMKFTMEEKDFDKYNVKPLCVDIKKESLKKMDISREHKLAIRVATRIKPLAVALMAVDKDEGIVITALEYGYKEKGSQKYYFIFMMTPLIDDEMLSEFKKAPFEDILKKVEINI